MSGNVTDWVANKLVESEGLQIVERTPEDFLVVKSKDDYTFPVAVLGVQNVIELSDVEPLFAGDTKPKFVMNVPSKTLWSGNAIRRIHAKSAAFGTLGDISRAASTGDRRFLSRQKYGIFHQRDETALERVRRLVRL